jgi:hypothetical protein
VSDYSDCYHELHKYEIEREGTIEQYRKRMINELNTEDMIKIMFSDYVKRTGASDVIKLSKEYLK